MARVPQVTRTIQVTKCSIMCVNVSTGETFTEEVTLPRRYKDDAAIIKQASSLFDGVVKPVYVIESGVEEILYGMTEEEFIREAKILPPRTKTDDIMLMAETNVDDN